MTAWRYVCNTCGHAASISTLDWKCPVDGGAWELDGPNDISIANVDQTLRTLARYSDVLPVSDGVLKTLGAGMTPLLSGVIAGRDVWFKLDSLLPTGSFKDRGAAVQTAHLTRLGVERVAVDSSGNAAAAMAAYCAVHGLDCDVFAPADASPGKLVQARAYGATVHRVEGDRKAVETAAQRVADADPAAYYSSHNWSPIFAEGVKTWALEVWEQGGQQQPGYAFVPTGGGSAFVGAWRGFSAVPGQPPKLIAAQPSACAPIFEAFVRGASHAEAAAPGPTLAEGARIALPVRDRQILAAIRESYGWAEAISEEEIRQMLLELCSQGIYIEPTAALGAAACRAAILDGRVPPDATVVVLVTGNGLKTTDTIGMLLN